MCPATPAQAIVNITDFGADPQNPGSYHQALRNAAIYIQCRGGYTTLQINAPSNTNTFFLVGKEEGSASNTSPYWRSEKIFEIHDCQSVIIEGIINSSTGKYPVLKLQDGQHMGLFDPVSGTAPSPLNYWNKYGSDPNACVHLNVPLGITCDGWAQTKYMTAPSNMFTFHNCSGITLKNIEIDGNNQNMIFGGYWGVGNKPYELGNHGILLNLCHNAYLENVNVHHVGCDGFLAINNITNSEYPSDNIVLKNCSFMHSGRDGVSWTGGRGLTMINCKSNSNATPSDAIQTSPAAGIDIEPESFSVANVAVPNACIDGFFEGCEFIGNGGNAISISQGGTTYSGNQHFINCNIGATSNPAGSSYNYIEQRNCNFDYCNFYGCTMARYNADNVTDATKFYRCLFTDCYNWNYVPNTQYYTTLFDGRRVRAEECIFTTYNPAKQWNVYFTVYAHPDPATQNEFHKLINCSFTKYNATDLNNVGGLVYQCDLSNGSSAFRIHRGPSTPDWNMFYAFDYSIPVPSSGQNNYLLDYNYHPSVCELNCSNESFILKDIKSFGATGNGITDDHAAFEAAETFFNTRGGKGILYISPGTYKVGKQNWNSNTNSFTGDNVLGFTGVSCLSIIGDNAKVVFNPDLKIGKYDAAGNPCNTCGQSGAGAFISLVNSEDITIKKSPYGNNFFELDGNINHFSGTNGINDGISHYGIFLNESKQVWVEGLDAHHFAQDGMTIWNSTPGGINTSVQNISVLGCNFKNNLMSGLAAYGVNGLTVSSSGFIQNSKNTGSVSPLAGYGIRLQTLGTNIIKDVTLNDVDISDNRATGLYVYGTGTIFNLNVNRSLLYGSTNPSVYMTDEEGKFSCCKIFGFAYFAGSPNTSVNSKHKEFLNCVIGDCYNGAPVYDHNYAYYGMLHFGYSDNTLSDLLISNCNFKTYTHAPLILYGNPQSCNNNLISKPVLSSCTFDINYINSQVNSGVGAILYNTAIANTICTKTVYVNNYFTEGCGGPAPTFVTKNTPDICQSITPNPVLNCPFRLASPSIPKPADPLLYVKNK